MPYSTSDVSMTINHNDAAVMCVQRKRPGYTEDGDCADEILVCVSHQIDANPRNMALGASSMICKFSDTKSGSSRDIRGCAAPPDSPLGAHHGTLGKFSRGKHYGFIEDADGSGDVFIHGSQLKTRGSEEMVLGSRVTFNVVFDGERGRRRATDVTIHPPPAWGSDVASAQLMLHVLDQTAGRFARRLFRSLEF